MDITERKAAEQSLRVLALEIDHRTNNILATAQSLVSLTRSQSAEAFRESLLGRIGALALAHRLLAENRWAGASLSRVVEEELRPFMGMHDVRAEGPDANLAPAVAQGVAVACTSWSPMRRNMAPCRRAAARCS
jgi:two-component sensor histidine kinase